MTPYKGYALFDLDQTLVPWDMQLLYANWVFHHVAWRRLCLAPFLLALPFSSLLGARRMKRLFLAILFGMSRAEVEKLSEAFVEFYYPKEFYDEMVAMLRQHVNDGYCVILTSASPTLYVPAIGRRLGVTHTFATEVEQADYMPLFPQIRENNKNIEKVRAIKAWFAEQDLPFSIPLQNSVAYTDSSADLPLVEITQECVLVNPSDSLISKVSKKKVIKRPARPFKGKFGKSIAAVQLLLGLYPIR